MSRKTCCFTKLIKFDQGLPKYAVAKKRLACSEPIGKTRSKISFFLINCISIKSLALLRCLTIGSQIFFITVNDEKQSQLQTQSSHYGNLNPILKMYVASLSWIVEYE